MKLRFCRNCKEELNKSVNWHPFQFKCRSYICKYCSSGTFLKINKEVGTKEVNRNKKPIKRTIEAMKEAARNYYKLYNEGDPKATKKYRNKIKKAKKEAKKAYLEKHRNSRRNTRLKREYGITLEDYNKMLEDQNGVCSICKKSETSIHEKTNKLRNLAVDHCHETGKVRGLLCSKCNRGLGYFKDNVMNLIKAAKYLIFHRKK